MTRRRPVVGCPSDDGIMRIDDFFQESPDTGNPWDSQETELNVELLAQLAQGTAHDPNPLETALSLTRLVRAEYESYGTEKAHLRTDEDEARAALKTLRMVLKRRGIVFNPPWRDFSSFQSHWHAEGARGSWQARRDIIEKVFRPIQDQLEEAEEQGTAAPIGDSCGVRPRGPRRGS